MSVGLTTIITTTNNGQEHYHTKIVGRRDGIGRITNIISPGILLIVLCPPPYFFYKIGFEFAKIFWVSAHHFLFSFLHIVFGRLIFFLNVGIKCVTDKANVLESLNNKEELGASKKKK